METTIMENQMEKKMDNELEYIGVIYYSCINGKKAAIHRWFGFTGVGCLVWSRVSGCEVI